MKYASQTATIQRDYHWNADSEDFRAVAEEEWLRWHYEYADIPWFGLISRNEKLLFLAGKIPTERYDFVHRRIITFIVLQPENEEETKQIINLTANILLGKEEQEFYSWADCVAMAQENKTEIPDWSPSETVLQDQNAPILRKEYPISEDYYEDRKRIASSLKGLVDSRKDFVVALINHSASKFYKKVCKDDLSPSAEIAVFSRETTIDKKFPEPKTNANQIPNFGDLLGKFGVGAH